MIFVSVLISHIVINYDFVSPGPYEFDYIIKSHSPTSIEFRRCGVDMRVLDAGFRRCGRLTSAKVSLGDSDEYGGWR
jgi:hypothetical protein